MGLGWKENLFRGGVVIILLSREVTLVRGEVPSEVSALLPNGGGGEKRGEREEEENKKGR